MKKNTKLFIALISIYVLASILGNFYFGQGKPLASYTFGWLFRRSFMYTWLLAAILLIIKRNYTAIFTTVGCFVGIILGDVIGGVIIRVRLDRLATLTEAGQEVDAMTEGLARIHYGILPIWFLFMFVMIITGLLLDHRKRQV